MLDSRQIEAILQVNGVSPTSPDETIRSILLSAKYTNDEVETAITILRENKSTNVSRLDGLHKVFRSDVILKPEEISALLGIEVELSEVSMKVHRTQGLTNFQIFLYACITIVLSLLGLLFAMYISQSGPFHHSEPKLPIFPVEKYDS
jgi:hypothetical protein